MAQCTSGWRSLLSLPSVYSTIMELISGSGALRLFVATYIRPESDARILDLGCGTATILEYLPNDVSYVGIDISVAYIATARKKFKGRGEFHCLPIEAFTEIGDGSFDLVLGLGVLHHLDDEQARTFFSIADGALKKGGRCVTIDPCKVEGQSRFARLLIAMDRGQNVRTANVYEMLANSVFKKLVKSIRHDLLRIPYTHLILEGYKS